jgi:tRNA G18 (ribose-2'-O)-methylase SpoU
LLLRGRFRVHSIAVTPTAADALKAVFEQRPDVAVQVCAPQQLEAITGFDFHRGCLALAWRPLDPTPLDRVIHATRLLALEGIGNPDNVGGLFRTAFALGVESVLLDRATADPLYRKAIRTSMGATLQIPFARLDALGGDLATLRSHGFRVVALTPHPDAVPLQDVKAAEDDRLVILVGSEGFGLTSDTVAHADLRVRIPIDPRADSLNVVVAAGIALNRLFVR